MKMSHNTILITGGTSGIGLELATQFVSLGNTVIVTGRDRDKLERVKAKIEGIHVFQSDMYAIQKRSRRCFARSPRDSPH